MDATQTAESVSKNGNGCGTASERAGLPRERQLRQFTATAAGESDRGGGRSSASADPGSLAAAGELLLSIFTSFIDRFCPADISTSDRSRCRLIVVISLGLAFWGPLFAALYLLRLHNIAGAMLALLATAWLLHIPFLLKQTGSIRLAGHFVTFSVLLVVTYLSYLGGGQGAPPMTWIVALPILALSLAGRSAGLLWAAIGILDLAVFYLIEGAGFDLPRHLTRHQTSLLQLTVLTGLIALLLSVGLISESQQQEFRRTLAARHADLLHTAAHLKAIVDYAPDAIVTFDARGIIHSFNPAAEALFGFRSVEVIGQPLRKLLPMPAIGGGDPGSTRVAASLGRSGVAGQRIVAQRRDRSLVALHVTVGQARIGSKAIFTAIMREISPREAVESFS